MFKRLYNKILFLILIIMVFSIGCEEVNNSQKIAYISANPDSKYGNTFKELHLGILFDFNFKLFDADKSWVNIWVEGYSNGKAVEPFPIANLSYGLSPNKVDEGSLGMGIINTHDEPQIFLYSSGMRLNPQRIKNIFPESSISAWDYAIGDKTVSLAPGEETVLAVYRKVNKELRTYDYKDPEAIKKIINEDEVVLLLKIKVEYR